MNISLKQQLAKTLDSDEILADAIIEQVSFWLENLEKHLDLHRLERPNPFEIARGGLVEWIVPKHEMEQLPHTRWVSPVRLAERAEILDDEIPF